MCLQEESIQELQKVAEDSRSAMEDANSRLIAKQSAISDMQSQLEATKGNDDSLTQLDTLHTAQLSASGRPLRRSFIAAMARMRVPDTPPNQPAVVDVLCGEAVDSPRHSSGFFEQITGSGGSQGSGLRVLVNETVDNSRVDSDKVFLNASKAEDYNVRESPRVAVYSPKPTWGRSSKVHPGIIDDTFNSNSSYSCFMPAASSTILTDPAHGPSILLKPQPAASSDPAPRAAAARLVAKTTKSSRLRMKALVAAGNNSKASEPKSPCGKARTPVKGSPSPGPFRFLANKVNRVKKPSGDNRRISRDRRLSRGNKKTISSILNRRSYQTRNKAVKKKKWCIYQA